MKGKIPAVVSLVQTPCEQPTNSIRYSSVITLMFRLSFLLFNFRVIYNQVNKTEGKRPICVCSKALYFPTVDFSLRMVEWIEVQRALGADKIFLYNLAVHPNMMKAVLFTRAGHRLMVFVEISG